MDDSLTLIKSLNLRNCDSTKNIEHGIQIRFTQGDMLNFFPKNGTFLWQSGKAKELRPDWSKRDIEQQIKKAFGLTFEDPSHTGPEDNSPPPRRYLKVPTRNAAPMDIEEGGVDEETELSIHYAWSNNAYGAIDSRGKTYGTIAVDAESGFEALLKELHYNVTKVTVYTALDDLWKMDINGVLSHHGRKVTMCKCPETSPSYIRALACCSPQHPRDLAPTKWYKGSYAVLIGINEYKHFGNLNYCENDVLAMKQCLEKLGFRTKTLLNKEATRSNIQEEIFAAPKYLNDHSRFVIFFAGHGYGNKDCFAIMPYDYDPDLPRSTLLEMNNFGWSDFSSVMPHHLLLILDCCHSGGVVASRSGSSQQLIDHLRYPARDVLVAGQGDQEVLEENGHGVFTSALIRGLQGAAFRQGKSWASIVELNYYILQELSGQSQTPQHFRLPYSNKIHQGMVVFERPQQ